MENVSVKEEKMNFGRKVILLGLQIAVLMIGTLVVWIMSDSRQSRNREVQWEITQDWGDPVKICAPFAQKSPKSDAGLMPERFDCQMNVRSKTLHRNIYEAEVYNAGVKMSGQFLKDSLLAYGPLVYLEMRVPLKQISRIAPLEIGGVSIDWTRNGGALSAKVDISEMPEVIDFSTSFDVRGSGSIYAEQIGVGSIVKIEGEASNPSFVSGMLPHERTIDGKNFSAVWESGSTHESVGINFLVGVDRYQKVERTLKYAFLIILLTYAGVLLSEILLKRNIRQLNYFLIGAALVLFYSLLLSFVEHLGFGASYLIAAAMTVLLIAIYMWKVLGSAKTGLIIGIILSILYACCYVLLSLETYALLLGSLLLFALLAALMFGSLKFRY